MSLLTSSDEDEQLVKEELINPVKGAFSFMDPEASSSRQRLVKRAVTLDNQARTLPLNVPDIGTVNSVESRAWDDILSGMTGNYWIHLTDGLMFLSRRARESARLWARDVMGLLRTQLILGFIILGSAIAITIETHKSNGFNIQMQFEFDRLIAGSYPAAPAVVGTVRLGWFHAGAFWFAFLVYLLWMGIPNFYTRYYVKFNLYSRMDIVRGIMFSGMISMFLIVGLGIIGVTNVWVIVLFTACFFGIYVKNHIVIPMHYAAAFSVLDAVFAPFFHGKITDSETGETKRGPIYARGVNFQDNEGVNGNGDVINAQDGPAKQPAMIYAKTAVDFVALARSTPFTKGEQPNPIMSDLDEEDFPLALRNYASGFTHAVVPYLYTLVDEIVPVLTFMSLFLVYYAAALQNDSHAFLWSVHFYFWWMFISLLVDHIVTRYSWSNSNHRRDVPHSTLEKKKSFGLLIDWITFSWFQWVYWIISFTLCSLILLASNRGTAVTLPPYH